MASVKVECNRQFYSYREVETLERALDNVRTVLRQREKQVREQTQIVHNYEAALVDLKAQHEAEKARKAERRKLKQTAA